MGNFGNFSAELTKPQGNEGTASRVPAGRQNFERFLVNGLFFCYKNMIFKKN
jgi:hypothetical protein